MQIVNFPTVVVDNVTGGLILTAAQAQALTAEGMNYVGINPSVDAVLVDATLGGHPNVPGSVKGTTANSPWTCPANTVTTVQHRSGPVYAISTAGNSTVKISGALVP